MSAAKYPRFVFKSPGSIACQGGTYSQELVYDGNDHESALANGWHDSIPETLTSKSTSKYTGSANAPKAGADNDGGNDDGNDNAPPTRAELEAQANKLGISFHPSIRYKKLLERIELKMQGGD